ncbi:hypothetical protein ILUMI_25191 [Ignelater luminosus]|uniref:Uncharacterized protein n=1 Tax=Ignelater luminosus TaxID=2038154 RepID=A0A8K0CC54_IGNLU|nr:hypothetical protein ILUMI_25191 [Ignelater luminosus]
MGFRLKTSVEELEKLESSGDSKRLSREASVDSFTSVIFPWRAIPQRPRQVAGNQAGREINPSGYFLCMASVMLLTTGIGICAATLWATIYAIPYMHLIDGAMPFGNNVFSFCAGILSIPCCWIACTSHDSKKNYTFLPLVFSVQLNLVFGTGFLSR